MEQFFEEMKIQSLKFSLGILWHETQIRLQSKLLKQVLLIARATDINATDIKAYKLCDLP